MVIGRWRPKPGERSEDLEFPGPGLYEIDFGVPGWLVPDFVSERVMQVSLGEYKVTHLASREAGGLLTVRLKIELDETKPQGPQTEWIGAALGVGRVLMAIAGASVGAFLMAQVVKLVREVRKLAETPAGIGLAALGLAGALVLGLGAIKGR